MWPLSVSRHRRRVDTLRGITQSLKLLAEFAALCAAMGASPFGSQQPVIAVNGVTQGRRAALQPCDRGENSDRVSNAISSPANT
jgi:hypothetical protein